MCTLIGNSMTLVNHFLLTSRAFTINVPKLPNCIFTGHDPDNFFAIFIAVKMFI